MSVACHDNILGIGQIIETTSAIRHTNVKNQHLKLQFTLECAKEYFISETLFFITIMYITYGMIVFNKICP